jgi:hypothetical protein
MKPKNLCNNTKVFNHPLVGKENALTDFFLPKKKMAELEPPSLVVMEHNISVGPQYQKEVPHPLQRIVHVLFPNNGAVLSPKLPVSSRRTAITSTGPTPSSSISHVEWKTLVFCKIR